MPGIFDGLEKFGLAEYSKAQLYEPKQGKFSESQEKAEKPFNIKDYIYSKDFDCPVCGKTFSANIARISKLKLCTIDYDLRPVYEPVDPLLYDTIICVKCGYGSVKQQFATISDWQSTLINKQISSKYTPTAYPDELTVDMAIERYKLVLVNALVKKAKDGEKAYICMKLAWLYRMKGDETNELMFIKQALNGFGNAFEHEYPPIMGLEECTVQYLLGAFSKTVGLYEDSLRHLAKIVVSKTASSRLKERAKDLKEEINELKKS